MKRKSLLKIDRQILLPGAFYVIIAAVYLFFECVIINYSPVLLHTGPEASYPSSHTTTVICIMATAMLQFRRLLSDRKALCAALEAVSALITVVTMVGRLLSGVHWFTDIAAGILLSVALVMLFYSLPADG